MLVGGRAGGGRAGGASRGGERGVRNLVGCGEGVVVVEDEDEDEGESEGGGGGGRKGRGGGREGKLVLTKGTRASKTRTRIIQICRTSIQI